MAPPDTSAFSSSHDERALTAELACLLTITERAAGALLYQAQTLTTALPLTMTALQAGTISWQHARTMIDETDGLNTAGTTALEAHFLDPGAPNPARGAQPGDLTPSRFRTKARTWRERHHPDSIEKRHTKSAQDRCIEYTPDRDGMARLTAYLPAPTIAGIWDRATRAARALQNPTEPRTLTQLCADITATWLLEGQTPHTRTGTGTGTGAAEGTGTGLAGSGPAGTGAGTGANVPSPKAQVLVTVPVISLL